MTTAERWLAELDREMPTTRRMIERVPADKAAWKPHPKSCRTRQRCIDVHDAISGSGGASHR
jgi:hypothetical protein